MQPYRDPERPREPDPHDDSAPERELVGVYAFVWLACLIRLVWCVKSGEAFGGEATLVVIVVVVAPFLLRSRRG